MNCFICGKYMDGELLPPVVSLQGTTYTLVKCPSCAGNKQNTREKEHHTFEDLHKKFHRLSYDVILSLWLDYLAHYGYLNLASEVTVQQLLDFAEKESKDAA